MDINKCLAKTINNKINLKGLDIEISTTFNEKFFSLEEEFENENIRIYIKCDYADSEMFLYVIAEMLKNNEATITFTERATEHHINYLKILSEEIK